MIRSYRRAREGKTIRMASWKTLRAADYLKLARRTDAADTGIDQCGMSIRTIKKGCAIVNCARGD